MKEYLQLLKQFRDDRGLHEYNHDTFINMITEESREILEANNWNHKIEEMCDVCVLCFNAEAQCAILPSELDTTVVTLYKPIDMAVKTARLDAEEGDFYAAISTMRDCITLNGYDFEKAMIETARKILSRDGAINPANGKWEKDPNQDKSTLYVPDYESCKLN